jgi:hypothetical protein
MNGSFSKLGSKLGMLAGLAAAIALPATAGTTTYQIDPRHSSAGFGVTHLMISTVRGEFHGVTGTVVVDDADISKSTRARRSSTLPNIPPSPFNPPRSSAMPTAHLK